ncbi:hypothetical protein OsJ_32420 [Oryza sativa Japonica Group]|uniref:Uncharacterized protein n=1 Tax=Oryza sativa subsp. japonica TaxID=39947 RepID=A3C776_ORYSJ|nr:hypothetical protein OsJ_32420 [Oryza sativa Japonica Group]
MAFSISKKAAVAALFSFLVVTCVAGARPGNFSASDFTADPNWEVARATWRCLRVQEHQPIRCVNHPACSGNPETVIITDMNYYPVSKYHFDLSGTAFGAMAKPGQNDQLRHAGIIDIQFKRVPCNFPGLKVTFHVEEGSNPVYFAVLVEYEDGDGDVVQVDLMEANSQSWTPMRESWGSIWRLDSNHRLTAPFSLRITNESGKQLVASQVIPANWAPMAVYRSFVQYSS